MYHIYLKFLDTLTNYNFFYFGAGGGGGGGDVVYSPFKSFSLILSHLFIKCGQKPENPRKNHLTTRK